VLVDRLDALKDEIRELNITLAGAAPPPASVGGDLLGERRHHHQWQLLVLGLDESAIDLLRSASWVGELGVRTPSLEEIVVAYLKRAERGQQPAAAEEVVTR
jgi:hypothetical protein